MTSLDRPNVVQPIDCPESDGSLIAESDWHRDELFDLIHRHLATLRGARGAA